VALAAAIVVPGLQRAPPASLRATIDAGANASVLPILSVASLVGFGAVVAAMPAFELVRDWVLGIGGGPLVSLAVATNVLAALTGSASGGLTIALGRPGRRPTCRLPRSRGSTRPDASRGRHRRGHARQPAAQRRGRHLLAVCGTTHRQSYIDIVMACIVGALIALAVVILLGSLVGSF
jgi:H+/gluconate symporter-like permease